MARHAKDEAAKFLQQALEHTAEAEQAATHRLAEQMLQSLEKAQ